MLPTQKEYFAKLEQNFAQGIEMMKGKNQDYCGTKDVFKNFDGSKFVGVPVEKAILVRMMDKISRVSTLLDTEAEVADEKIEDTLIDLQNYANILNVYLYFKKKN